MTGNYDIAEYERRVRLARSRTLIPVEESVKFTVDRGPITPDRHYVLNLFAEYDAQNRGK